MRRIAVSLLFRVKLSSPLNSKITMPPLSFVNPLHCNLHILMKHLSHRIQVQLTDTIRPRLRLVIEI